MLHQARGTREQHVRGHRADDDQVDVLGLETGPLDRFFRRLGSQVAGGDARVDDVALANAGALHDPLVGGVDHLLEIGVGQQARRHVGGQALDLYSADVQNNPLPGIVCPKYS